MAQSPRFLARQYSLPFVDPREFTIERDVLALVPPKLAIKHCLVPLNAYDATLVVAFSDPSNIYVIDELKFLTQRTIEPVVAEKEHIETVLDRLLNLAWK